MIITLMPEYRRHRRAALTLTAHDLPPPLAMHRQRQCISYQQSGRASVSHSADLSPMSASGITTLVPEGVALRLIPCAIQDFLYVAGSYGFFGCKYAVKHSPLTTVDMSSNHTLLSALAEPLMSLMQTIFPGVMHILIVGHPLKVFHAVIALVPILVVDLGLVFRIRYESNGNKPVYLVPLFSVDFEEAHPLIASLVYDRLN